MSAGNASSVYNFPSRYVARALPLAIVQRSIVAEVMKYFEIVRQHDVKTDLKPPGRAKLFSTQCNRITGTDPAAGARGVGIIGRTGALRPFPASGAYALWTR